MLAYFVFEFEIEAFPEDRQPQWMEFGGVSLLKEDTFVVMRKRSGNDDAIEENSA